MFDARESGSRYSGVPRRDRHSIRRQIADSWARCRRAGIDPANAPLHRVSASELSARLESNADLIAAAGPHLDWISALLEAVPHVVYVTDADGIVLASGGNDPALQSATGLEPGYDWSEARMGTNGAGTALVTGRPEAVVADEHFVQAFKGCTCTAAPIIGPDGVPVGALDLSTRSVDGGEQRLLLVMHAARVIERDLRSMRDEGAAQTLRRLAGELLTPRADAEVALQRVPRAFVRTLADWAVLWLPGKDGAGRVYLTHREAEAEVKLRRLWADADPTTWTGHPLEEVLRTGTSALVPELRPADVEKIAMPASRRELLRQLAPLSWLCVPIPTQGTHGALLLGSASNARSFGGRDLAVAQELAALIALFLDDKAATELARERAVEAESAQSMLHALLEHVPEGITIAAAPDVHIVHVSRHGQHLIGREEDELRIAAGETSHATTWRIRHADGRPAQDDELPLTRAVKAGVVSSNEEWLIETAQGWATILTNAGPIRDADGRVTGGVIAWRDITDRKRAEEALLAREAELRELYARAEQAIQDREQLLAVVSHDLRNPLSILNMASSLLLEAELPDEKKAAQVRLISRVIGQMRQLVEDLLDVSRLGAGALRLDCQPLDPQHVLDEAVAQVIPLAEGRNLTVQVEARRAAARIHGDSARLVQTLNNLLGNAIRYSPEGGRISVGAAAVGAFVEFHVADEGPGIVAEDRPRLFDRFWQGGHGPSGGAGLGLAICKGIVEMHGGRIWLDESATAGTTIRFTIPTAAT
jgi:PAS domain S-box-containing protein